MQRTSSRSPRPPGPSGPPGAPAPVRVIPAIIAVAIAAQTIGKDSTAGNHVDYFHADKAFLYTHDGEAGNLFRTVRNEGYIFVSAVRRV